MHPTGQGINKENWDSIVILCRYKGVKETKEDYLRS